MKTFLVSPRSDSSRPCAMAARTLREAVASSMPLRELLKNAGTAMRRILTFDYMIYIEPAGGETRSYRVWPDYNGTDTFIWPLAREQDIIVRNSYHDTLVRICGHGDYSTITVSVLLKYMREAHTEKFSLIFLRKVVQERFIGLIGFVSFKKDAYNETDAAALFELLDAFNFLWNRTGGKVKDATLPPHDPHFFSIINLPGMQKVLRSLYKISREDFPVLLLGETGTGKEGIANMIYRGSGRHNRPFIKINCGGIPLSLMESKLFGYQKGAFTGAEKDTPGCFELADTGTLLLDELGELPVGAQAHLLRVLQEGVIERVGSSVEIPVNVRIIAATNRNLDDMVRRNRFRQDLLYRLSVFPIYIPALRERTEDIPVLLEFFILQQSRRIGFVTPPKLAPSEVRRLCEYPWPGNIREMQNAVIRAMLLWDGAKESRFTIEAGQNLFAGMFAAPPAEEKRPMSSSLRMEDMEREHIRRVLDMAGGRISGKDGAAQMLDMNPSTLRARMKKLGIVNG